LPSSTVIKTPPRAVLPPLVEIDREARAIFEESSSFSTENFKPIPPFPSLLLR
jgi:hypothetical protein